MARPVRAYLLSLSERYNTPLKELLPKLTRDDILELMAFDRIRDDDWVRKYNEENMTQEQIDAAIMAAFSQKAT